MISHTCPHCGTKLDIPDEYAGRRGGCKQCGGKFTVPAKPNKKPASERQLQYLRDLGAAESELHGLDRATASNLINDYITKQRMECPECHQMIDSDSNYCMWCGNQVNQDLEVYRVVVACQSKEGQEAVQQLIEWANEGGFDRMNEVLEEARLKLEDR